MKKKVSLKRGVTIIEAVVALAIIAIVSVMSVSMSLSSIKNENKNLRNMEIVAISSTAIDCFNFAETEEEFLSLLKKSNDNFEVREQKFVLSEKTYTLLLSIESNVLTTLATDTNGKEIYNLSYKKQ